MPMRAIQAAVLLSCVLTWPAAYAATELKTGPNPLGAQLDPREILTVDEAFALSAELSDDGFLVATWRMPDGYYLYRHRFKFSGGDGALGTPMIPDGKHKTDEFFGDVEVYYDSVTVRVPVLGLSDGGIEVEIGYQGCADFGLCYPPEEKRFTFAGSAP